MSAPLLYVTGTNTGVGKTTLARLLLQRAKQRNLSAAAMKPFCSGGREDAEILHALQTAGLSLDEVNPFYFDEPLAPYIAARNQKRTITAEQTIKAIQNVRTRNFPTLIEGAGGLMSPLGERFTLADLIRGVPGHVCVVGANILGVINAALLTHGALKSIGCNDVRFALMNSAQNDPSARSNANVIREWTDSPTVELPFLDSVEGENSATALLDSILDWWIKE